MKAENLPDWGPELPWTPLAHDEQRFRRIFLSSLGLATMLCVVIPHIPVPHLSRQQRDLQADNSQIIALAVTTHFELPQEVLAPPKPAKTEAQKVQPQHPKPSTEAPKNQSQTSTAHQERHEAEPTEQRQSTENRATSQIAVDQARAKAQAIMKAQGFDQLASLREMMDSGAPSHANELNMSGSQEQDSGSDRALITSARTGSGGLVAVGVAGHFSSGFGSGKAGSRQGQSIHAVAGSAQEQGVHSGLTSHAAGTDQQQRTGGDIARIFDRFNGALQALYQRALRDNPALQGSVTLKLSVAADGTVTDCSVVSSQLNDPELEQKIVLRVKLFHFDPVSGGVWAGKHTINFLPPS